MNEKEITMKSGTTKTVLLLALLSMGSLQGRTAADVQRIGTYDSRSVVIAYAGSEIFRETVGREMEQKQAELKEAEAAGDEERVKALNAWGEAWQAQAHLQAFSTAPVDEILALIPEQLAGIQEKASVDILLSKWDEAGLGKYPSAVRIDVTMQLIDAFNPGEQQRQFAMEVQTKDPVPLTEMKDNRH